MKCCLSEETTLRAWELERTGKSRTKFARDLHVCGKTLQRLYKYYGFGSPKRIKEEVNNDKDR